MSLNLPQKHYGKICCMTVQSILIIVNGSLSSLPGLEQWSLIDGSTQVKLIGDMIFCQYGDSVGVNKLSIRSKKILKEMKQ